MVEAALTSRERIYGALDGRPVDRTPVTVPYATLYHLDHFSELTGRPAWHWNRWLNSDPVEYCRVFEQIHRRVPLEMLQPHGAPSLAARESVEFVEKDGQPWRHDLRDDSWTPMTTISGHAMDYHANEVQRVFSKRDADRIIKPWPARERIASGTVDYIKAVAERMKGAHFILSAGVVGVMFSAQQYLGQTNMLVVMMEAPDLFDYVGGKVLDANIEEIRAAAFAGGDAIFIDETFATSDAISPAFYERFCLPRTRAMVEEIHRLGHKAFVFYFGGVADRLALIEATGADAVLVEASMKGYVNDVVEIARRIGGRMCLFGNIDPLSVLEQGSDEELAAELERQAAVRRFAKGYIASTGSPITPRTSLARIGKFIELGGGQAWTLDNDLPGRH